MEKISIKILKHYSMSAYPYNIKIKNCILIFILTSDLILKYSCAPCHKFFGCCIANTKLIGSNIKFFFNILGSTICMIFNKMVRYIHRLGCTGSKNKVLILSCDMVSYSHSHIEFNNILQGLFCTVVFKD